MRVEISESELKNYIQQIIAESIEEREDEGFINQIGTGVKSFFGKGAGNKANRNNGDLNLRKRWNAAKTGYEQQGVVDNIDNILSTLYNMIEQGKIDPNQTVGQLVSKGRFQKGNLNTMRAKANSNISSAKNDIYR